MTERELQSKFVLMKAQLIQWAYANGYELTDGEAYRTPVQAIINSLGQGGRQRLSDLLNAYPEFDALAVELERAAGDGIVRTLHRERLAQDFNLFRNGVLLTSFTDYQPLGQFWESLGGSWGGRFGDLDHFSLSPDGGHTR